MTFPQERGRRIFARRNGQRQDRCVHRNYRQAGKKRQAGDCADTGDCSHLSDGTAFLSEIWRTRLHPQFQNVCRERYDQFERAKNGELDVMIGPRSALFTPFSKLGMIIIDEEHETSYKSETMPRYHARETAIARAGMEDASVLLGSATPSMESFYHAKRGAYVLLELEKRIEEKPLPACYTVDLREELRQGNRSILSEKLQELMEQRLEKHQQIMLFINRQGLAGLSPAVHAVM